MNHKLLFSVNGDVGFYRLINLNFCLEIKRVNDICVSLYIWWIIGFKWDTHFNQYTEIWDIKMRQTDYCFLKHYTLVWFCKVCLAVALHLTHTGRSTRLCLRLGKWFIKEWKLKPRVSVFHCKIICFDIRDLIISLYRHKHHTLSYNIINVSAALKIMNFDKTSIGYRSSKNSFHMHL